MAVYDSCVLLDTSNIGVSRHLKSSLEAWNFFKKMLRFFSVEKKHPCQVAANTQETVPGRQTTVPGCGWKKRCVFGMFFAGENDPNLLRICVSNRWWWWKTQQVDELCVWDFFGE